MKHNNQLPNAHFHKHWQMRVKCWFDQPGSKKRRRLARMNKASRLGPRPTESLRPAVHCPTVRYNSKLRAGRGFTLEEIKAAGLNKRYARTIGISVDHRRKNRSLESLQLNTQRLKTYLSKLVLFPKNPKKPQKGEATLQECSAATQHIGTLFPITQPIVHEAPRKITESEKSLDAFKTLRKAKTCARFAGRREKKVREKAAAEEDPKKKK